MKTYTEDELNAAVAAALEAITPQFIAEAMRGSLHEPYGQILSIAEDIHRMIRALTTDDAIPEAQK